MSTRRFNYLAPRFAILWFMTVCNITAQALPDNKLQVQLATAIAEGDAKRVELALNAGANAAIVSEDKSAWYLAITTENYQPDIVKLFKPQPGDLERAAGTLPTAALSNNFSYIERLAKLGVALDARNTEMSNETALMIAAFDGFSQTVRILLKYGANTTLKNSKGQTALDIAKTAVKEKRWLKSDTGIPEADYKAVLALLRNNDLGVLIGKIHDANERKIQIIGKDIDKLKKGSQIRVKTSARILKGNVTEVLHSKAKATLDSTGAQKGDAVYLQAE